MKTSNSDIITRQFTFQWTVHQYRTMINMKVYTNKINTIDNAMVEIVEPSWGRYTDNMVIRNDVTLYFNITLLLLFGHAFFGTFNIMNAVHRMNLVLAAIFLFFLCFPLKFIIAWMVYSTTFGFMIALTCKFKCV